MVLFAAAIGTWSRMSPPRRQGIMFVRALLMVVGALLLQMVMEPGTWGGAHFAWLILAVGYYSFLLPLRWGITVGTLALLEFALASWMVPAAGGWPVALASAGALIATSVLSLNFGRSLRQSDEQSESALRDGRTMLYNESGFFIHGAVLLDEARRAGKPFSMVLLSGADLRDIPELLGRKVANDLFNQAVQAIGSIPGDGIAARVDAVEFALLLPGVPGERAAVLVKQRLGDPPQLLVHIEGKPIVIVLDMAIAQAREKGQSIEELYDSLHARWAAKKANRKPAPPAAPELAPDGDRKRGPSRGASPTVPMPLPPHLREKK